MKTTKLLFITLAILGCVMTQNDQNQLSNGSGFFDPNSIFGSNGFNILQQQQHHAQPVKPCIVYPAKKVEDDVAKAFDASTTKLTDLKAKLIKEIEDKYLTFGLSRSERRDFEAMKSGRSLQTVQTKRASVQDQDNSDDKFDDNGDKDGNVKRFRGSRTDQIKSIKKILAKIQSEIQDHLAEFNKQIDNFFKKTQSSIRKLSNENSFFDDSKILKTDEFTERIHRFFDNQIRQAKLIYSGSRDGFAASKFHQKCNNQASTLTVVKTDTDKVFGGYAAIPWDSSSAYGKDDSKKSFVYQLNYNDKFSTMVYPQYAIYKSPTYGPTFGGGHDFYIVNNSNVSGSSYTNIGHSYSHPSYTYGSNQARVRFAGGYNFKVRQLQVWKLTFGQKCSR